MMATQLVDKAPDELAERVAASDPVAKLNMELMMLKVPITTNARHLSQQKWNCLL